MVILKVRVGQSTSQSIFSPNQPVIPMILLWQWVKNQTLTCSYILITLMYQYLLNILYLKFVLEQNSKKANGVWYVIYNTIIRIFDWESGWVGRWYPCCSLYFYDKTTLTAHHNF